MRSHHSEGGAGGGSLLEEVRRAPGKSATTSRLARRAGSGLEAASGLGEGAATEGEVMQGEVMEGDTVQADGGVEDPFGVHLLAEEGVRGAGQGLPHLAEIQQSFGHHDVRGVRAQVGGEAAGAAAAIGTSAYATGDRVAFASSPDLRQAAHEAAHVVQQRGGVRLDGGVGKVGDVYEQHAEEVAAKVVRGESAEALLDPMAHRGAAGGPAVQRDNPRAGEAGAEEAALEEEVSYAFFFTGGDAYGTAARAYLEANYPDYERRSAGSMEEMFEILDRELNGRAGRGGRGRGREGGGGAERDAGAETSTGAARHVGHIILVSHAAISAPTEEEAAEGAVTAGDLYIAPTRGSDERVSAESLAQLQAEFRAGLHARFRRARSAVVGSAIDENTMIEIRGCRIAQSAETMAALRDLFGGAAEVRAPTGYQGYGILPWDEARTPLPDAIEILIEQGSVPASSRELPEAEQRQLVESFVAGHGGLPTQHFVPDGTGDREAFGALSNEEATAELLEPGAGPHAHRDHVDGPGAGGEWGYAGDPEARDPALERLPSEELERRARALLAEYRPEVAPELQRLRNAWLQVTLLHDDLSSDDPLAGLPPEEIFGDASVIDRDAARVRGRGDRFEEDDIVLTEPTERQRDELSGAPETVSVAPGTEEAAAPEAAAPEAAAPVERAPERRTHRPHRAEGGREGARGGEGSEPASDSAGGGDDLRIIGHARGNLVFNRPAFRSEVIAYLWGGAFTPNAAELVGIGDVVSDAAGELEIGSERWMLARNGFAARPEMYSRMRPEARALVEESPDLAAGRPPDRPAWVPSDVWQQFLAAGPGMHRYRDRSDLETDLVLVRREGMVAGYAEAQEREEVLYRQLSVEPPDRLQRILGTTTVEQHRVHLMARASAGYNEYMWREVSSGVDPLTARARYPEAVLTAYLLACVSAVGFMGSMAPSLASP